MSNNTNSYIVLTEQGLSAVATQPWPQIAIKYFLPMYDERVDTLIHTDGGLTSALPLTAAITSADSQASLVGERIYNIPSTSGAYKLTSKYVATSAAGASFAPPETIFSTTVNKTCSRTTINGYALAPVVSGNVEPTFDIVLDELHYTGGEAVALPVYAWPLNGANIKRENLFDSVSFNPSQTTSGSYNVISGLFKFTLRNVVGDYRFNKIAFFIQPMNADGTVNDTYDPILFGQTIVDVSQIVQVGGTGSQSFEITVQLAFTIKDSMVVLTNNDYWSMIPTSASTRNQNGLFFAGDVALGTSSVPNSWQPRAKMHITDDSEAAQIRLSHSTGLLGVDFKMYDTGTSGVLSFTPTNSYSQGFGFTFGRANIAAGVQDWGVAFAQGVNNTAIGETAFALGTSNSALTKFALAFGFSNIAKSNDSSVNPIAIGMYNRAIANSNSPVSIAIGYQTSATGGIVIGYNSITTGYSSYVLGNECKSLNAFTMNLGKSNSLYSVYSYALGFNNVISGAGAYNGIIGYNNLINNNGQSKNWIVGADNVSLSAVNSVMFGNENTSTLAGASSIVVGNNNNGSYGGILFGHNNNGPGNVFGEWSYAYHGSFAAGTRAFANSQDSVAIGHNVNVSDVAVSPIPGLSATVGNVGIGKNVDIFTQASYSIGIGVETKVSTISGFAVSIGYASRSSYRGIALGRCSLAYGIESVALGSEAQTYGTTQGVIDDDIDNNIGGIAIGSRSTAWNGNYGIAIGYGAEAKSSIYERYAASFGYNVKTDATIFNSSYPMVSVGSSFTNQYAGFMCGLNPSSLDRVKVKLGNDPENWTFTPSFVAGGGDYLRNNVLMAGQLVTSAGTKSALVLDETTMIDVGNVSVNNMAAILQGLGAPKGTIFRGGLGYGVSYLYIYDGGV